MSSNIEAINLHLLPKHISKLTKGASIQLTKDNVHTVLTHAEPNVELHLPRTEINGLFRAMKAGKGKRILAKHIHGGKISLKHLARKVMDFGKKAMKNPIVRETAKQLGHIAVAAATQKAADAGYNTTPYSNLAHNAIESGHVDKNAVGQQLANDIVQEASKRALEGSGKKKGGRLPKSVLRGANNFGKALLHGIHAVTSNPIAQQVATNVAADAATTALMGAGKKRGRPKKGGAAKKKKGPAKGSAEMKEKMARLRAMRKKKGGALFPA
eukprot:scaffold612_cov122-Ochromonas_danica.AAC.3